jgi:hypothetical protein
VSKPTSVPKNLHLIWIEVKLFPNGRALYTYFEFVSKKALTDKKLKHVKRSDLVGFFLSAVRDNRRFFPPFRVTFESDALLGTRVVDVPEGGSSPLLPVVGRGDTFKYEVALPTLGIDPDDPEIQMDSTGIELSGSKVTIAAEYDPSDEPPFEFTYQVDAGEWNEVPAGGISVHPGDQVTWQLTATPRTDFQVQFQTREPLQTQAPVRGGENGVDGTTVISNTTKGTTPQTVVNLGPNDTSPAVFFFLLYLGEPKSDLVRINLIDP